MRKTDLANCPQWLLDADTGNEDVCFNDFGVLQWNSGDFWGGNFRGGNFCGGNFRGGNFCGGDFWGGDFRGEKLTKNPQTLYGLKWVVYITKEQMQIGCQRHSHAEWEAFGHDEIKRMASGAFDFWMTWRTPLLMMCMQHREEP